MITIKKINRLLAAATAALAALALTFSCAEKPENETEGSEQTPGTGGSEEQEEKSHEAQILSFTLTARGESYPCKIDQETKTITFVYDESVTLKHFRSARAEYELSEGASIEPDPASEPMNYTDTEPLRFTVTAQDGQTSSEYSVILVEKQITPEKPVVMWIDISANFQRLARKMDIVDFLQTMHKAGINGIVVDVKSGQGDALYESEFLPYCTTIGGHTVANRDYDYLQTFIDEARKLGMRVSASVAVMSMGSMSSGLGPAMTDPWWDDKVCVEYLPDVGLRDIRKGDSLGAFVNPAHPGVHEYIRRMVTEILSKYDIDSFVLDYCRYLDINSDFSDYSREKFEQWLEAKVENWPEDIYTFNSSRRDDIHPQKLYNKWVEWRALVIQDVVTQIRQIVKSVRPDCPLEYWAASWWPLPHTGQNWASASNKTVQNYWWASGTEYYKTGFADQLDIFQLGSYLNVVRGRDNNASVEFAINKARDLLNGECELWGTISCASPDFDLASAIDLCLKQSDGCMVFELSHVVRNKKWDAIREGVDRYLDSL